MSELAQKLARRRALNGENGSVGDSKSVESTIVESIDSASKISGSKSTTTYRNGFQPEKRLNTSSYKSFVPFSPVKNLNDNALKSRDANQNNLIIKSDDNNVCNLDCDVKEQSEQNNFEEVHACKNQEAKIDQTNIIEQKVSAVAATAAAERDRIAREQQELAFAAERDRIAREQQELAAAAERDRVAREQQELAVVAAAERDRIAREQQELAVVAAAAAERDRIAREQQELAAAAERDRIAREKQELAAAAERDRIAREQQKLAAAAERDRIAREQQELACAAERDRIAREQQELAVVAAAAKVSNVLLPLAFDSDDVIEQNKLFHLAAAVKLRVELTMSAGGAIPPSLTSDFVKKALFKRCNGIKLSDCDKNEPDSSKWTYEFIHELGEDSNELLKPFTLKNQNLQVKPCYLCLVPQNADVTNQIDVNDIVDVLDEEFDIKATPLCCNEPGLAWIFECSSTDAEKIDIGRSFGYDHLKFIRQRSVLMVSLNSPLMPPAPPPFEKKDQIAEIMVTSPVPKVEAERKQVMQHSSHNRNNTVNEASTTDNFTGKRSTSSHAVTESKEDSSPKYQTSVSNDYSLPIAAPLVRSVSAKERVQAADSFDTANAIPECSEKCMMMLYNHFFLLSKSPTKALLTQDEVARQAKLLHDLLLNESLMDGNIEMWLSDFQATLCDNPSNYTRLHSLLYKIMKEIQPLDMMLSVSLSKKVVESSDKLFDKDIVLLLGPTGAGKSTTIHYFAGSTIKKEYVDGLPHYQPKEVFCEGLDEVVCSPFSRSETRVIKAIGINFEGSEVVFCDTPGFEDTDSAEVDIANGQGLSSAIRRCRSIKPIILISKGTLSDRSNGIKRLLNTILTIFNSIDIHIASFSYVFSKFSEDEREDIKNILKHMSNNIPPSHASDELFVALLSDMAAKTAEDVLLINVIDGKPQRIMEAIIRRPPIYNPENVIRIFVSAASENILKIQLHKQENSIRAALGRSDMALANYKMAQLKFLGTSLSLPIILKYYNVCTEEVAKQILELQGNFNMILNRVADIASTTYEADINALSENANHLMSFEVLRHNHLADHDDYGAYGGNEGIIDIVENCVFRLERFADKLCKEFEESINFDNSHHYSTDKVKINYCLSILNKIKTLIGINLVYYENLKIDMIQNFCYLKDQIRKEFNFCFCELQSSIVSCDYSAILSEFNYILAAQELIIFFDEDEVANLLHVYVKMKAYLTDTIKRDLQLYGSNLGSLSLPENDIIQVIIYAKFVHDIANTPDFQAHIDVDLLREFLNNFYGEGVTHIVNAVGIVLEAIKSYETSEVNFVLISEYVRLVDRICSISEIKLLTTDWINKVIVELNNMLSYFTRFIQDCLFHIRINATKYSYTDLIPEDFDRNFNNLEKYRDHMKDISKLYEDQFEVCNDAVITTMKDMQILIDLQEFSPFERVRYVELFSTFSWIDRMSQSVRIREVVANFSVKVSVQLDRILNYLQDIGIFFAVDEVIDYFKYAAYCDEYCLLGFKESYDRLKAMFGDFAKHFDQVTNASLQSLVSNLLSSEKNVPELGKYLDYLLIIEVAGSKISDITNVHFNRLFCEIPVYLKTRYICDEMLSLCSTVNSLMSQVEAANDYENLKTHYVNTAVLCNLDKYIPETNWSFTTVITKIERKMTSLVESLKGRVIMLIYKRLYEELPPLWSEVQAVSGLESEMKHEIVTAVHGDVKYIASTIEKFSFRSEESVRIVVDKLQCLKAADLNVFQYLEADRVQDYRHTTNDSILQFQFKLVAFVSATEDFINQLEFKSAEGRLQDVSACLDCFGNMEYMENRNEVVLFRTVLEDSVSKLRGQIRGFLLSKLAYYQELTSAKLQEFKSHPPSIFFEKIRAANEIEEYRNYDAQLQESFKTQFIHMLIKAKDLSYDDLDYQLTEIENITNLLPVDVVGALADIMQRYRKEIDDATEAVIAKLEAIEHSNKKFDEYVNYLIQKIEIHDYRNAAKIKTKIRKRVSKLSNNFFDELRNGHLLSVFEMIPRALCEWEYYSTVLTKQIIKYVGRVQANMYPNLTADEEVYQIYRNVAQLMCDKIAEVVNNYILTTPLNTPNSLKSVSTHFEALVTYVVAQDGTAEPYRSNFYNERRLLVDILKNGFHAISTHIVNHQKMFAEATEKRNYDLLSSIMDNSKAIPESFYKKVSMYCGTEFCGKHTPAFKEEANQLMTYDMMSAAFTNSLVKYTGTVRTSFVNNLKTKSINGFERDEFYGEVSESFAAVSQCKQAAAHVNQAIGNIHSLENECREFFNNEMAEFEKKIISILNSIPTADANVYQDINLLSDNFRSISEKFEDTAIIANAKDRKNTILRLLRDKLNNIKKVALTKLRDDDDVIEFLITIKTISAFITLVDEDCNHLITDYFVAMKSAEKDHYGSRIAVLGLKLNAIEGQRQPTAQRIIREVEALKSYALKLHNERTGRFTFKDVMDNITADDTINKVGITNHFEAFKAEYWSLVDRGRINPSVIPTVKADIVRAARICVTSSSVSLPNKARHLMAHVFAFWTLDHLSQAGGGGTKQDDLWQPHAAQIVAIFRLLGIEGEPLDITFPSEEAAPVVAMPTDAPAVTASTESTPSSGGGLVNALTSAVVNTVSGVVDVVAGNTSNTSSRNTSQSMSRRYSTNPLDFVSSLKYHLVQIPTGEGKSIALAVTSIVLALLGCDVDCACYSEYLSKRDKASSEHLFSAFSVAEAISYGTFNQLCEKFINKQGDIRELTSEIVLGSASQYSKARPRVASDRPRIIIIDEVDVFFSKEFYGNEYRPLTPLKCPSIIELIKYIWINKTNNTALRFDNISKTPRYKACLADFKHSDDWSNLLGEAVKEMVSDLKTFNTIPYIVDSNSIGYKDQDGVSFKKTYGYKTMFAYFHEHDQGNIPHSVLESKIGFSIDCGSFSYAEIPLQYKCILGVTGTLQTLCRPEKQLLIDVYKISTFTYMPSVYGKNKLYFAGDIPEGCKIENNSGYFGQIATEIKSRLLSLNGSDYKRAVLVFFESTPKLLEFYHSTALGDKKEHVRYLIEETPAAEKDAIIKQAVSSGSITLLNKIFGRGTDFICYDEKLIISGGIHVIQTFVSHELSEETQIKGRTARQGNSGSYSMVLLDATLEVFGIRQPEIDRMTSTNKLYSTINASRCKYFEDRYPESMRCVTKILSDHTEASRYVANLIARCIPDVKLFLLERNKSITTNGAGKSSRTVVLMDATGSMSGLIEKSKNTVEEVFKRIHAIFEEKDKGDSFELQFVIFRNYDCDAASILVHSGWETKPIGLKKFMNSCSAVGGTHWEEAVEVALAHAVREDDKDKINQVILIGDAAPNTDTQVTNGRKRKGEAYWANLPNFATATTYRQECLKLKERNVPIHAFYVDTDAEDSFSDIAQITDGSHHFLDVNDLQKGAQLLQDRMSASILFDVGGEEYVSAYKNKFGFTA